MIPNTVSFVSTIDWTVTNSAGTFSGSTVVSNGNITFDFPGTSSLEYFELKGLDAQGRLRAGGSLGPQELSGAATPVRFPFFLYDYPQAFAEARMQIDGGFVYLAPDGRVGIIGGRSNLMIHDEVWEFSPRTGLLSVVGHLKHARQDFGALKMSDGRFFIAGGTGELGSDRSAEIWDPLTRTSSALEVVFGLGGMLSIPRPFLPEIVQTGLTTFWVVGGGDNDDISRAADVIDLNAATGFSLSTTRFHPQYGGVLFSRMLAPGTLEFRQWGGTDQQVGDLEGFTYNSAFTTSTGVFTIPIFPLNEPVVAHGSKTIVWGTAYACGPVLVASNDGVPSGAVSPGSVPECKAGIAFTDAGHVVAVGASRIDDLDIASNSISQRLTIDGSAQKLVFQRNYPLLAPFSDGTIVVVGGRFGAVASTASTFEIVVRSPN